MSFRAGAAVVLVTSLLAILVRVRVHGLPLAGKKRPPLNLAVSVVTFGSRAKLRSLALQGE